MQVFLQGGIQKLEQQPEHEEDVPTKADLVGLVDKASRLLQLKEAGNRCATTHVHWLVYTCLAWLPHTQY